MTAPIYSSQNECLLTRRSVFIGAAASLICAPAIVRATSLMPVRQMILPMEPFRTVGPQYAGFVQRLMFQTLDNNLNAGEMSTSLNGRIIPEAEARRIVANARAQGWLKPLALGVTR